MAVPSDLSADLEAWLHGRSLARACPMPVAIPGGWRVTAAAPGERRRYVFPAPCPALWRLGRVVTAPHVALKLCGGDAALRAGLPPRWVLQPTAWLMAMTVIRSRRRARCRTVT